MKITKALKAHLVKTFGLAEGASDDEARKLASEKLLSGELKASELAELTKEPDARAEVKSLIDEQLKPINSALGTLTEMVKGLAKAGGDGAAELDTKTVTAPADDEELDEQAKAEQVKIAKAVERALASQGGNRSQPFEAFLKAGQPRVKSAAERYSTSTKALCAPTEKNGRPSHHPHAGEQLFIGGRGLNEDSQLDLAVKGAYFKAMVNSQWQRGRQLPQALRMTDHDRDILAYALHELPWTGEIDDVEVKECQLEQKYRHLVGKALLDDSTSGGQNFNLAPQVFDDIVVRIPLLHGELFPYVDLKTIAKGKSVRTPKFGNVTLQSGPASGSAMTPFTTTSLASALDTDVFPVTGSIEIGNDFMEDSLVDIGKLVTDEYGQAFLKWLDEQIANGDGTTEPQGIFVAGSTVAVNSANGTSGPFTVGDFEQLMFGVSKAVRNANGKKLVFISSDTTYRRAKAVPVGESDARRVFGMDHLEYKLLGLPYKVQNDITDSKVAACNMGYYRMWRRRGAEFRVETGGATLALADKTLMVMRARIGGRLTLSSAAAIMTDAPVVNS